MGVTRVTVIEVNGKEGRRLVRERVKENRRKRLLLRMIRENRRLRQALGSPPDPRPSPSPQEPK